jgi:hypothetical protein
MVLLMGIKFYADLLIHPLMITKHRATTDSISSPPLNFLSAVIPTRSPLEQDFKREQNVPQSSCPRFFLVKLQLYRRVPNLVLDNPAAITSLRTFSFAI